MLERGSSYRETRACPCLSPLLTPAASGGVSIEDWLLLFLVLTQEVEHLGVEEKAKL